MNKKKIEALKEPNLDHKKSILSLLKKDGLYLKKLEDKYKRDIELVRIAIENNVEAFKYVPKELKIDRTFILSLLKTEGYLLEYLSDDFKKDKELVMVAVSSYGYALEEAHETLRADKEVVLEAIRKSGRAVKYAHKSLLDDREIALYILENDNESFKYISPVAKLVIFNDQDLMIKLLKVNLDYVLYLKKEWKSDRDFMLKLILESPSPMMLQYASEKLKADKDFVLKAINHNGYALSFASSLLQQDKELFLLALKDNGAVWQTVGKKYFKNNKEVVLSILEQGLFYLFIDLSDELKGDEDILKFSKKYKVTIKKGKSVKSELF